MIGDAAWPTYICTGSQRDGFDPRGDRLIEEPSVQHDVHRAIGSLDMDRVQSIVPESSEPLPRGVRRAGLPPSGHQFEGVLAIPTLSQHEHHVVLGVGGEIQMDLECRAGIPPGLHVPRETPALQRRWAVAACPRAR